MALGKFEIHAKGYWPWVTQLAIAMNYKTATSPGTPVGGVNESSIPARGVDRKVEAILSDIVTRLERIEEKIDENVYPPESAMKSDFVKDVKKARSEIDEGISVVLLVSLKSREVERKDFSDWEVRMDELAQKVSQAWKDERSAVEILSEMRR